MVGKPISGGKAMPKAGRPHQRRAGLVDDLDV